LIYCWRKKMYFWIVMFTYIKMKYDGIKFFLLLISILLLLLLLFKFAYRISFPLAISIVVVLVLWYLLYFFL
ncbi:MAG: hypothetical protein N7Q72_07005, partial [Spiroplasma sp. Tabriz.8]|nr:hypothetical protein [Spiroplasma sp. Tabriz.8]